MDTRTFNGITYDYWDETKTFHQALAYCENLGGTLAVSDTPAIEAVLKQMSPAK